MICEMICEMIKCGKRIKDEKGPEAETAPGRRKMLF